MVNVFTDGGCNPNPGEGGWAWVLYDKDVKIYDYGGYSQTTNNRMELTAIINFLEYASVGEYTIHSDSSYCLKGIVDGGNGEFVLPYTGWLNKWKSTGFNKVKNPDLWKELDSQLLRHHTTGSKIRFSHVRGHTGVEGNEEADRLATRGIEETRK